ncbi:MAG: hypothetical protein AABZ06_04550 [Bdellovibrionota bacterium]
MLNPRARIVGFLVLYVLAIFLASKSPIMYRFTDSGGVIAIGIRAAFQIAILGLLVFSFLLFKSSLPVLKKISTEGLSDIQFAAIFGLALFASLFPNIAFFLGSPLLATGWELQDPITSWLVFWPDLSIIRTELIKRGNLLWTNLQGMGVPLLGNDVQAAALYPLTLGLIWLPEHIFWNVFVTIRMALIGMACLLIGLRMLYLSRPSAILFTLCLAYGLTVVRWMNHAWQNGFLAGLWYLYFLNELLAENRSGRTAKSVGVAIGLTISAYALFTCGFPESAAMSTLLVILVGGPMIIAAMFRRQVSSAKIFGIIFISLLLAGSLASHQILALIEFINQTGRGFREGIGSHQHKSITTMLSWATPLLPGHGKSDPPHFFGIIPLFFFYAGAFDIIIARVMRRNLPSKTDIGALLAGTFFILKAFPLWPAFNRLISSLPIMSQSWFPIYFFPLMSWFFAYFSAKGLEQILSCHIRICLLSVIAVIITLFFASQISANKTYIQVLIDGQFSLSVVFLFGFITVIYILFLSPEKKISPPHIRAKFARPLVLGFVLVETMILTPTNFRPISHNTSPEFGWWNAGRKVTEWLGRNQIPLHEIRLFDIAGSLAGHDLSTPDAGAPPILHERMRALRESLFVSEWQGYLPLQRGKTRYSWSLISNQFFISQDANWKDIRAKNCPDCILAADMGDGIRLIRNTTALPRAYIASRCFPAASANESLSGITNEASFRLGDVYLETTTTQNQITEDRETCLRYSETTTAVPIVQDRGFSLQLTAVIGPAIVVLNDAFYPGWKAFDHSTGIKLPIYPANHGFRAVVLPHARKYEVEFRYIPRWLTLANRLTFSGIAILLGTLIFLVWLKTKKPVF